MKRTITTITNSNNANVKANLSLEGVVVAVTAILDSQITKQGKYWTALVCDSNQNLNRIAKYLSSKTNCSLHPKIIEYLNNQNGIKLNKLKFSGDNMYTASNETIAAPKVVTFTPTCTQISTINDIQSMSDGQYVSLMCKIIDIGPDDTILFNNGPKKVQKLKRTTIIADKTDSINMNLWENQFDLIETNLSYKIKLAKIKIFNNDV
ncbi:unnamed protein product [Adineta steineri]|uniref:Uncharacterized protein n=1 Tax=Adineta steineri TaxID=433720 RepID=A0A815KW49_9BILA|nr:unnamed protein product [Adineta steineri]